MPGQLPAMANIMIVGGGFAGSTLAKRLMGKLPDGWDVVLVSEDSYTTYNPLLPEVVGAGLFPEHAVAPLRQVIDIKAGGRFIMGAVSAIDTAQREITCSTLMGEQNFGYDHLVLALGNRARLDLIPGMADHALPLKSIGDALHIRNMVLRRLAAMELEPDHATRGLLGHFLVIGGGYSGVEVAGAIVDCLKGIGGFYPHAMSERARVTLVHSGDRLLPEMAPKLGEAALQSLRKRNVDVRLLTRAAAIDAHGADLRDGGRIDAATIVSTIGTMPNPLVETLGLPLQAGRIGVGPTFAVPGLDTVWALGDCACITNGADGQPAPPTAQFAVAEAGQLARNLIAVANGRAAGPFMYRPRGAMAATGHLAGVAEIFGLRFSGLIAWMTWRGYYLLLMPTIGRKLRIFVEWTWGMFFAPDITHIHFTRSGGASGAPMVVARRPAEGEAD